MGWSITLGRFWDTSVRIHLTFLLFLAWIGFSAYHRGGLDAARDSLIFIIAIFTCVVLHEFGHILTARQFGIVSPQVTLLPIGGVASMSKMPDKPSQELLIALAGPCVNLVIAAVLLFGVDVVDPKALAHLDDPNLGLVERLAMTNVFLAVFNMVPAFPMDGGRVLRAGLAMWLGEDQATRIAALTGQALALAFGFIGLFGYPMLIFIAFFIFFAASGEAQVSFITQATKNVRVADAMETRIASFADDTTIGEAVDTLLATSQESFPLLDRSGALVGLLSRLEIVQSLKTASPTSPIAPFARREISTISANDGLNSAIEKLNDAEAVGVIGSDGSYQGLVTRQSVADIVLIKGARPEWRFKHRAPAPR